MQTISFLKIPKIGRRTYATRGTLESFREHGEKESIDTIFREINEYGYQGFFFDLLKWRISPLHDFHHPKHQCIEQLKTAKYIRSFFFLPIDRSNILRKRLEQALRHHDRIAPLRASTQRNGVV